MSSPLTQNHSHQKARNTINVSSRRGPGFITNNRGNNQFQFGQQSTIDAATQVTAAWNQKHPNRPFSNWSNLQKNRFVNGHHNHFHVRLRMKGDILRINDKGSDVAEVQERLGMLEPDGVFGSTMLNAVEAFQAAHQLDPDGKVGSKTFKALGMD